MANVANPRHDAENVPSNLIWEVVMHPLTLPRKRAPTPHNAEASLTLNSSKLAEELEQVICAGVPRQVTNVQLGGHVAHFTRSGGADRGA